MEPTPLGGDQDRAVINGWNQIDYFPNLSGGAADGQGGRRLPHT